MAFNIFNEVHKPLKLSLLTTCIRLTKNNNFNMDEAIINVHEIEEVLSTFNKLIAFENLTILPLIFEWEPSIWNYCLQQHAKQRESLQKLQTLLHLFNQTKNEIEKFTVLISISEAFNIFLLDIYNHMDDEEEILNKVLWQFYDDRYLKNLLQNLNLQVSSFHYKNVLATGSAKAA